MDVQAYLAECAQSVERALDAALPPATRAPRPLHAAMRHLLFPGGKALRAALAMAAAEAVGGSRESALPVATAVELVQTYSLIHDDLPCMDDDALRRGRPAVHAAFGEALGVLAGDALLAAAFEVLAGADAEPGRLLAATRELAAAAGSLALVGGQADDLAFRGPATAEAIEDVHARKSAALIAAAVTGGARLGGADESSLGGLRRFASAVGVGFQIADDLLDRDEEDACSLLAALTPEAARDRAEALLASALEQLEGLGSPAEPLRELARFAVRRTA